MLSQYVVRKVLFLAILCLLSTTLAQDGDNTSSELSDCPPAPSTVTISTDILTSSITASAEYITTTVTSTIFDGASIAVNASSNAARRRQIDSQSITISTTSLESQDTQPTPFGTISCPLFASETTAASTTFVTISPKITVTAVEITRIKPGPIVAPRPTVPVQPINEPPPPQATPGNPAPPARPATPASPAPPANPSSPANPNAPVNPNNPTNPSPQNSFVAPAVPSPPGGLNTPLIPGIPSNLNQPTGQPQPPPQASPGNPSLPVVSEAPNSTGPPILQGPSSPSATGLEVSLNPILDRPTSGVSSAGTETPSVASTGGVGGSPVASIAPVDFTGAAYHDALPKGGPWSVGMLVLMLMRL